MNLTAPRDRDLAALLDRARDASPLDRITLRDEIAGFGGAAIDAVESWLSDPILGAFAVRVIERAAAGGHTRASVDALRGAAAQQSAGAVRADIDAAIKRLAPGEVGQFDRLEHPPKPLDEVIDRLRRVLRLRRGLVDRRVAGLTDHEYVMDVTRWAGTLPEPSNARNCSKGGSLLRGADGTLSCLEVEVVRGLRGEPGWGAGWVQGWACGKDSWGAWIWATLPRPVGALNGSIQTARGLRASSKGGHPDVALIADGNVLFLECKMDDSIDKQVDWVTAAIRGGFADPRQIFFVGGV